MDTDAPNTPAAAKNADLRTADSGKTGSGKTDSGDAGSGKAGSGETPARNESEAERLDRNYGELLQELRVTQVGVQILFASLLSIAFSERFRQITEGQRTTYVVTLLAAAAATAFLIGPVSFHRLVFRNSQKDDLVRNAHRMALGGLVCLVVAVVGAVLLILEVVLGQPEASWFSVGVAAFFVVLWLVVPLVARTRGPGGDE